MDLDACVIDLQNACLTAGRRNGQIWKVSADEIRAVLAEHLPGEPEPVEDEPAPEEKPKPTRRKKAGRKKTDDADDSA